MSATLSDIARETRTSISTVSRVLAGGTAARRISRATAERVRAAAQRLGYRPNLVARSLRTRKSDTIALLISDISNPFFGQIGNLIERSLHRHGYSLMLCNSGEDPQREVEYLQLLSQKAIGGLIVVPMARTRKQLLEFLPQDLPIVVLDRPVPGINSLVASDQDQAAGILCDAMERAGVKTVALVAGPQEVQTHRRRAEVISQRMEVVFRHEGPAQPETGRQAYIQCMGIDVDAFACTNNFLALGVIDCIAALESPPVIGCFDEIPLVDLLPLPIVASLQDVPMLAESCVTQLLRQLNNDQEKPSPIILQSRAKSNKAFHEYREQHGKIAAS